MEIFFLYWLNKKLEVDFFIFQLRFSSSNWHFLIFGFRLVTQIETFFIYYFEFVIKVKPCIFNFELVKQSEV